MFKLLNEVGVKGWYRSGRLAGANKQVPSNARMLPVR
jgi:hypothetical protein